MLFQDTDQVRSTVNKININFIDSNLSHNEVYLSMFRFQIIAKYSGV